MTDLHTHILPGMDDGAPDLEHALALLELERQQGVKQIALTSHFRPDRMELRDFLSRREDALGQLRSAVGTAGAPELKAGCEVYYSPRLADMDLDRLCLEGTDLLLLELPTTAKPRFLTETMEELSTQGYTMLIAHAERYAYVAEEPGILGEWMEYGAWIQLNASSLIRGGAQAKLCRNLLRWGLAHVISSDAHSTDRRPPNLDRGLNAARKMLGEETALRLERNARGLFCGDIPDREYPHIPRKFLGHWI